MKNLLDNLNYIKKLDKFDMLGLLEDFPGQLKRALKITDGVSFPKEAAAVSNIVFSGLGGSAIGGDVVRCCLTDELKVPLIVNRDYNLPGFVDSNTLFFASSYSGNTEETLSAYKEAKKRGARIIVMTSGGQLQDLARSDGYPVIEIPEKSMSPRCALGYSFVPILSVFSKIKLIGDKEADISETIEVIGDLRNSLVGSKLPLAKNTAKEIASDLSGRFCAVYGPSRHLDCAITRWRNQFCENSKALATSHFLPEMDHNEIMGFSHPENLLKDVVVVFLRDKADHPRVSDRIRITGSIIKKSVHKIIEVESRGGCLLSRICSLIYIGDFVSFYLAILNGEDPTPVDEITYLKKELKKRGTATIYSRVSSNNK
jgi:glucose/mannose-6-phosphate isomerase